MIFNNLEKNNNILEFEIHDISLAYINSFRRIILAEIPNIAIDFDPLSDKNTDLNIKINKSSLHNEYLGHRISLIPLCFSENEVENYEKNNYKFILKVKNTTNENISVTTNDIQIYDKNNKLYSKEFHEHIFPKDPITNDYILITRLKSNPNNPSNGEEIDIEFTASKDIAKQHARWCPVSCCTSYYLINQNEASKTLSKILSDKENEFKRKLTQKEISTITNKFNALDIYRIYHKNKYDEACAFKFKIETECNLRTEYLFFKSMTILIDKLSEFSTKLQEEYNPSVKINRITNNKNFFEIIISDKDYDSTLIVPLCTIIYNRNIRNKENEDLTFVGYPQMHPLDKKMCLKLNFVDDKKITYDDVKTFIVHNVNEMIKDINLYIQEWINFSKLIDTDIDEIKKFTI